MRGQRLAHPEPKFRPRCFLIGPRQLPPFMPTPIDFVSSCKGVESLSCGMVRRSPAFVTKECHALLWWL